MIEMQKRLEENEDDWFAWMEYGWYMWHRDKRDKAIDIFHRAWDCGAVSHEMYQLLADHHYALWAELQGERHLRPTESLEMALLCYGQVLADPKKDETPQLLEKLALLYVEGYDFRGALNVLARIIYGFRISVLFGLVLTLASAVIGVSAGAVQGYFGGWTDLIFQRVIEIWSSIPVLYLILIIAAVLPPGFFILLGIMLLFSWVAFVGVVRAEFLRARNFEYVNAARALGVSNGTIMFRHLLPNAMVATLTFLPFILNGSITTLTSLDFLGFGLPPGSASLGELLRQGQRNLNAPWLGITGFLTLSIMLSLLIFIGEAVRDAFDPRKTFK